MNHNSRKTPVTLQLRAVTWLKDSHSLFDYESQKSQTVSFSFSANSKSVSIYRKRESSTVVAFDEFQEILHKNDLEDYQFLTRFEIKSNLTFPPSSSKLKLEFDHKGMPKLKKLSSERLNTDESNSGCENKEEDTYVVINQIKDHKNEQQGFKLAPGHTIKLGRVQYFVSEVRQKGIVTKVEKKELNNNFNNKVFKYNTQNSLQNGNDQKDACRICLDETETPQNFLFKPCLCTCAVHIDCLTKWIQIKVKKQSIGGTTHFNFTRFDCEVCKFEFPMRIEVNNQQRDLLCIQKPEGNYLILEEASQKSKSAIMLQNLPKDGIKLGRGHECEIRIVDISVSRSHAFIKNIEDGFYVFDNKSKFGTLVKMEPFTVQIGKLPRAVQIGRTIVSLFITKDYPKQIRPELASKTKINDQPEIKAKDRSKF